MEDEIIQLRLCITSKKSYFIKRPLTLHRICGRKDRGEYRDENNNSVYLKRMQIGILKEDRNIAYYERDCDTEYIKRQLLINAKNRAFKNYIKARNIYESLSKYDVKEIKFVD